MKILLKYLFLPLFVLSLFSCEDDSIQERREKEKKARLNYVREQNIPDEALSNSGLYIVKIKEGSEDGKTLSETMEGDIEDVKVSVFYTFYHLDGRVIDSNCLYGFFDAYSFPYNKYMGNSGIKQAWTEAIRDMKEGDKVKLVIPSALYSMGEPYIGTESFGTNQFITVVCDLELSEIKENTDRDME